MEAIFQAAILGFIGCAYLFYGRKHKRSLITTVGIVLILMAIFMEASLFQFIVSVILMIIPRFFIPKENDIKMPEDVQTEEHKERKMKISLEKPH